MKKLPLVEKTYVRRPCVTYIEEYGWPDFSGQTKWIASLFLLTQYRYADKFSEDDAIKRLTNWRNSVSDRPIKNPSEQKSDIDKPAEKIYRTNDWNLFSCKKIQDIAPDSCCELGEEPNECFWKQTMDNYQNEEERKLALRKTKEVWNHSGWEPYLINEWGEIRGTNAINLYNAFGTYAVDKKLSPDYPLNLGTRRWADEICKTIGHKPTPSTVTSALHVLENEGLIKVKRQKFVKGENNKPHEITRIIPIPSIPKDK